MDNIIQRFRVLPYLVFGLGLLLVGYMAIINIVDNFWPIDVARLDLIRASVYGEADATTLLQFANYELILAFLASEMVALTGLALPLAYFLNKRFGRTSNSGFLTVLRQAMWIGLWVAFCTWLQMNRSLNWGVAILVAAVLFIVEVMLQLRTKATALAG